MSAERAGIVFGLSAAAFLVGIMLVVAIGHFGCWNVPIADYRYCKRIGYAAYDAQRDTAYWAQYGMKP